MTSFAFLSNNSFLKVPGAGPDTPYAVAGVAWDGSVTNRVFLEDFEVLFRAFRKRIE